MSPDVNALADQIRKLSPVDRLRVAIGLLERGQYATAEPIVQMVANELATLRLLKGSGK